MVFYIATMVSQLVFALYYCFGFDLLNSRYNLTVPGARTFSVSGDRIIIRKTEPGADVFGFIFSPKEWGGGLCVLIKRIVEAQLHLRLFV